jgi:hypothetical protein
MPTRVNEQPPVQDEAVQTVLRMNQKHILFPYPGIFQGLVFRIFQPPSLPQNFPLLPTSLLLFLSLHFPFIPSPELE